MFASRIQDEVGKIDWQKNQQRKGVSQAGGSLYAHHSFKDLFFHGLKSKQSIFSCSNKILKIPLLSGSGSTSLEAVKSGEKGRTTDINCRMERTFQEKYTFLPHKSTHCLLHHSLMTRVSGVQRLPRKEITSQEIKLWRPKRETP